MTLVLGGLGGDRAAALVPAHLQAGARAPRPASSHNLVASMLVVIFGFLFVTVSSRICGLIGTSANPVSGHDHRHPDGDLRALPGRGLDGARLRARWP